MKRYAKTKEPIKRSGSKFVWLLGVTAVVFALLYWELPGLLYVLSTLAMCALFMVVAFSDLKREMTKREHAFGETVCGTRD